MSVFRDMEDMTFGSHFEHDIEFALRLIAPVLGQSLMETISDALQHYFDCVECHCYDGEDYDIYRLCKIFDNLGFNSYLSEYDILCRFKAIKK